MPATFPKHEAIYVKKLVEDLRGQGYSEHQVFHGTGVTEAMLEPDKPIAEFDQIAEFFEHASELTGDDTLGFMRGQKREMRRSGLICYVGVSSPTVLDFIQNVTRYRRVFSDAIELDCSTLENDGVVNWHFSVPAKIKRRQYVEFGASGFLHALRQAANRDFHPELVVFSHARNANIAEFETYFGCEVRFGAPQNSVKFKAADLALPLITADDELYKILKNCCDLALQTKARNIPPLIVDVERSIADRLTKGEVTQDDVAKALGMSPRTLARRLANENTTFFKTLEGLRKALALNYLHDSSLVLAEISFLLGYSGMSSFNDAFKRWTGTTPGQYRNA
jgi:AraC-like DNA-binding protein